MNITLKKSRLQDLNTTISDIPGDKSISHRAIMIGALSENSSEFHNVLFSEDCVNTMDHFEKMGVLIKRNPEEKSVRIQGVGKRGLRKPTSILDCGNAGTSIRLMTGLLAGQSFETTISGDIYIQRRPMARIITPLIQMGADIKGIKIDGRADIFPPLTIRAVNALSGIDYTLPVASAQVKSAILLASLYSQETTTIIEPKRCRNHSETMLAYFGADIAVSGDKISCSGLNPLANPAKVPITIPSDISSAAFFVALGLILKGACLNIEGIGLNSTRDRILAVFQKMGGNIELRNRREGIEPTGDIVVQESTLTNLCVDEADIPIIIDEIPILAVVAVFGKGELTITGASELRAKESDRIAAIGKVVTAMGGQFSEKPDGFTIIPAEKIQDFKIDSCGDHRIAMAAIIGAIGAGVSATITDVACIQTSFPNFFEVIKKLGVEFSHD